MEAITKRFNKSDYAIYAAALLEGIKTANDAFKTVAEVAARMNGKVYNKRFFTACNEANAGKGVSIFAASYSGGDLSVGLNKRDTQINGNCCYFDREIYLRLYYNRAKYLNAPAVIDKDGRINAEGFAAVCAEAIKENERRAATIRDAVKSWDESIKALEEIKEAARKIAERVNPLFVDTEGVTAGMWFYANIYEVAAAKFGK